jgi:hypothetical protein
LYRYSSGPTYVRKDHSLASITDRIVGEFDECNGASNASGVVTAAADGSGGGSTAAWRGNVPVDGLG